jgi:hypothetical protein
MIFFDVSARAAAAVELSLVADSLIQASLTDREKG